MKKGILFKKFNIIDLLIVLIVIAGAIFLGIRFLGGDDAEYSAAQNIRYTFFSDEAPALLAGKAAIGSPVTDYDSKLYLGTLRSFDAEDAYEWNYDSASGELVKIPVPNTIFLTFSCDGTGLATDDGIWISGTRFCIGGTYVICAGQTRISCRLANAEVID